jgi:molecular chaperone GrpE (heat shock protein)
MEENNPLESENDQTQKLFNPAVPLSEIQSGNTLDESDSSRDESHTSASKENVTAPVSLQENLLQELLKGMAELRQDFDVKVKYDESKERLITNLHKELQFYRDDLHFRILKPMFIDLITLYDDLGNFIDSVPQDSSTQLMQHLVMFKETVEEILHRNGVDTFNCEQETFLPSKQRNLRVVPTTDPAQDKYIAKRVRPGFEYGSKLLRHEIVETYKYAPIT